MTRYFYTDPLAAAWMAKHFGMKFKSPRGQNMYYDGGSDFRTERDCGFYAGEKYYIHPDSVGLLEPMEGDVITDTDKEFYYVTRKITCDKSPMVVSPDGVYDADIIIQRNGTVFHWPESED